MIIEKTTVVYNSTTKEIIGEFEAGVDLYPAKNCDLFEGTKEEFLLDNPSYSVIQVEI